MNWIRRHKIASGLLAFIVLVAVIMGANAGGSETGSGTSAATSPVTVPTVSAVAITAAPTHSAAPQTVTFEVTGSDAQVTYGPAGSDLTGTVPMHVTQKLGSPAYYSLQAQLQGGGNVTVKILVNDKIVSKAEASGGYNIAMAEISQDPLTGGWQSDNG